MVLVRRDTTKRRHANGHRLHKHLIKLANGSPLFLHTMPLWYGDINASDDIQTAKKAAQTLLEAHGVPPAWVKLESGRCGLLHLHIITPLDTIDAPRVDTRFIYFLRGIADYLSKPHDARLCRPRPKHHARYTREEIRVQFIAALTEQDAAKRARNGKRSPARSWTFAGGSEWRAAQQEEVNPCAEPYGDEITNEVQRQECPAPRCTQRPQYQARPRAQRRVIAWRWSGGICSRGLSA